jgi:hypothetical protein
MPARPSDEGRFSVDKAFTSTDSKLEAESHRQAGLGLTEFVHNSELCYELWEEGIR